MSALIEYGNRAALMTSLAILVAEELRVALTTNGKATLAVPGGSTPVPFFNALSMQKLDWCDVRVFLTDERLVDENSDRSNTALLKDKFLIDAASAAQFIDIRNKNASEILKDKMPIDVCVLGMGADMHTASLFPSLLDTKEALISENVLANVSPKDGLEKRITLTGPILENSVNCHVLIAGSEKKHAYIKALSRKNDLDAPIRVVLKDLKNTKIHYAN